MEKSCSLQVSCALVSVGPLGVGQASELSLLNGRFNKHRETFLNI